MTKEEFNALSEEEKQSWLEMDREEMEIWEGQKEITKLPYPENLIRSAFGFHCVIKKPVDDVIEDIVNTLPDYCKDAVDAIFKNYRDIESLADEKKVLNMTAIGYVAKALRLLRHRSRSKKLRDYVEVEYDEE